MEPATLSTDSIAVKLRDECDYSKRFSLEEARNGKGIKSGYIRALFAPYYVFMRFLCYLNIDTFFSKLIQIAGIRSNVSCGKAASLLTSSMFFYFFINKKALGT